jgi:hypothetical protein
MTVKNNHSRWTDEDVRRLRLFADANVDTDTIAKSLGRTRASVQSKAHWLNLSLAQKPQRMAAYAADITARQAVEPDSP